MRTGEIKKVSSVIMIFVPVCVVLIVLALVNRPNVVIGPKFNVGDCIALDSDVSATQPESWEKPKPYGIEKVLEVGHAKYRTYLVYPGTGYGYETYSKIKWDSIMVKVDCPAELR